MQRLRFPNSCFSDARKNAINDITGELLPWKWPSLNATDFCIDHQNNLWHSPQGEMTWSAKVRRGLSANNFFENAPPLALSKDPAALETASQTFLGTDVEAAAATKLQALQRGRAVRFASHPTKSHKIGKRGNNKASVSTSGRWYSRRKKYRKKKYKNSNIRPRKHVDKRYKKKAFYKERNYVKTSDIPSSPNEDVCAYCLIGGSDDNIFDAPYEKHSCDCCGVTFTGAHIPLKVCGCCLDYNYRRRFCNICEKNLGAWRYNWRLVHNVPQSQHPRRCECSDCYQYRSKYPCHDCGGEHTQEFCPWNVDRLPGDIHAGAGRPGEDVYDGLPHERYGWYDDEIDAIEEASRDDYLFGWG